MSPAEALAAEKPPATFRPTATGRIENTLRQRREALRLTLCEVARGAGGFTHGVLASWERGLHHPNVEAAVRLARFFGCTIEELWPGIGSADAADMPHQPHTTHGE